MIDPTREEWLEAMRRVTVARGTPMRMITTAALGPCPPEPLPKDWYAGVLVLSAVKFADRRSVVIYCDDPPRRDPYLLTPDEADAMAAALVEHATSARKQGDDPWRSDEEAAALIAAVKEPTPARDAPVAGPLIPAPICGRVLDRKPSETSAKVCQRPKGHSMPCASEDDE